MKSLIKYLIVLICLEISVVAASKEYVILGGQKITAKVKNGMPLPAEKSGITVDGAGFALGEGKLVWAFDFITKKVPVSVLVEDVSGVSPIVLVKDLAPSTNDHGWNGQSSPVSLSKEECPWLYDHGDTTKVFRFTIMLSGSTEPVIVYQPAVYPESTKKLLRQMAH